MKSKLIRIVSALRLGVLISCMAIPGAFAAPLATFSGGKLSGFTGILVGSSLFNVSIQDGTCAGVFGSGTGGAAGQAGGLCNVASFAFHSAPDASAASSALYVAITGAGFNGLPDSILDPSPAAVHNAMIIWTPFDSSTLGILTSDLRICAGAGCGTGFDGEVILPRFHTTSTANANSVWGNWSPTPVPEPETYAMLLAGLGLLGFVARRRTRQAA